MSAAQAYPKEKDMEVQPLLDVRVAPMRYGDVWKGGKSWFNAFENDPLINYMNDNERAEKLSRFSNMTRLSAFIMTTVTLTVEKGAAVVVVSLPTHGDKKPASETLLYVANMIASLPANIIATAEQKKRRLEVATKAKKLFADAIGDRAKDLLSVDLLFTSLESQGHGYGTALMNAVTEIADDNGYTSWVSAVMHNEEFYNSFGFFTVATAAIGDDNPTWKQDPVIVNVGSHTLMNPLQGPGN